MTTRDLEQLVRSVAGSSEGRRSAGKLVARTRAAVTDLAPDERTAVVEALRGRGADGLAQRVMEAPYHPVWSDQLSGLAQELLSGDPRITEALAEAGGLGAQLQEGVLDPRAPSTPIPPPPGADPNEPRDHRADRPPEPAETIAGTDAERADAERVPDTQGDGELPAAADTVGESALEEDAAATDGPAPVEPPSEQRPAASVVGRGHPDDDVAPATPVERVRHATTARDRVRAVTDVPAADLTAEQLTALVTATPTGWQRRRVLLRLLDDGADDVPVATLRHLARPGDRVAVADRLLRRGVADLEEVVAELPAGAAARLRRRHGA